MTEPTLPFDTPDGPHATPPFAADSDSRARAVDPRFNVALEASAGTGKTRVLVDRYVKRIAWPVRLTELPDSGGKMPAEERDAALVVLDEKGRDLSSTEFAKLLAGWRDAGKREARFLIGAADGHDPATLERADLLLSFGKATWPHLLVRAMLAEQLFRATAIVAGHPYHRDG